MDSEPPIIHQFDVTVERVADGYFVASVPPLPGCHAQAKSLDDLLARIQEAIALCLEVQGLSAAKQDFNRGQRVTVQA